MSFTISGDMSALNQMFAGLDADLDDAVRPAAQAGAEVLYNSVQKNVAALGKSSGRLAAAIYQAFSHDNSHDGVATYHIGWNSRIAPHAWLVEFGHIQRYAVYVGTDGRWHTAVRPEMRGKRAPRGRASQAEKDAYYVLRKGGPKQIAARSFVRAAASAFPKAIEAATTVLIDRLNKK